MVFAAGFSCFYHSDLLVLRLRNLRVPTFVKLLSLNADQWYECEIEMLAIDEGHRT